jgi:integrase/recombinase XerD
VLINLAEAVRDVRSDDDLIEAWLCGRPTNTQEIYRHAVRLLREQFAKPLRDITSEDLVEWYDDLAGAANSRDRRFWAIKSLFGFGFRSGVLPQDPGRPLKLRHQPVRRPDRVLDRSVVEELLTRCPPGRDRTLVRFLYATGARPCEVSKLCFGDLLADRVLLDGKGKQRFVPVDASIIRELQALRQAEDRDGTNVFRSFRGRPMSTRTVWYIVKRIADEVLAEDVPPYALRHSFATHKIEEGTPVHIVQKLLGHASLQTTSIYVHPPEDIGGIDGRRGSGGGRVRRQH